MNRLESLKDNLIKNRILVENFSFLSALHVTNLVLFIITIPYLFRVLGSRTYGLIVFAQTIAFYFSIFVNFGFNLTATRDVSVNRNDKDKLTEIVSSVLTIKTLLFIVSILLVALFSLIIPQLRENNLLFIFSMLACLSEALFPVWYFQGIEKMQYITFINVATRVFATGLIFTLVNSQDDYVIYPLLLGLGTVTGAIMALIVVFKKHMVRFRFQPSRTLRNYLSENLLYFFSNVSTQIYVNASKVIIGLFLGMVEVAYYDIAEKIINVMKVPYSIIGQTLFPKVARDKDFRFLNRIMIATAILTTFLILGLSLFSGRIIMFFSGQENANAIGILKILSLTLIPISIGLFYGDLRLINFGLKKEYTRMRFAGLVLYLAGVFGLYYFNYLAAIKIAFIVLAVEAFMMLYSYLLCKNAGIS